MNGDLDTPSSSTKFKTGQFARLWTRNDSFLLIPNIPTCKQPQPQSMDQNLKTLPMETTCDSTYSTSITGNIAACHGRLAGVARVPNDCNKLDDSHSLRVMLVDNEGDLQSDPKYRAGIFQSLTGHFAKPQVQTKVVTIDAQNLTLVCHRCFLTDPALKFCGKCRVAPYCGRTCQRQDWSRHRGTECVLIGHFNSISNSPLHEAASMGNVDGLKRLLCMRADVNATGKARMTPLGAASYGGHKAAAEFLVLHNADVNLPDKRGATPLIAAAANDDLLLVKYFLQKGGDVNAQSDKGSNALMVSAKYGNLAVVRYLVSQGISINEADIEGMTPLFFAICNDHIDVVRYLVHRGASINAATANGGSLLSLAAGRGAMQIIQLLVEQGVEIEKADNEGSTSLHCAVDSEANHIDVVWYLIQQGARINAPAVDGFSPLMVAVQHCDTPMAQLLVEQRAEIEMADDAGYRSLHYSAQNHHIDVARYLIQQGAHINAAINNRSTPLPKWAIRRLFNSWWSKERRLDNQISTATQLYTVLSS